MKYVGNSINNKIEKKIYIKAKRRKKTEKNRYSQEQIKKENKGKLGRRKKLNPGKKQSKT